MENLEFQEHILKRIQKLEKKDFGATFEENYTSRQQAENISSGKTEGKFIGERTRESALQRVKSFGQNYDDGAIASLYGEEIVKFQKEKAIVQMLLKKYNIQEKELE